MAEKSERKKEIYTYQARWPIYAQAWSNKTEDRFKFRMAVGSFIEEYKNKVMLLHVDRRDRVVHEVGLFDHPYPPTKIMFSPTGLAGRDLIATSGDYLRLWALKEGGSQSSSNTISSSSSATSTTSESQRVTRWEAKQETLLNNNRNSEYCAPLTSFDWCASNPAQLGCSSIDTTCTIWDINESRPKTQLIAHDKEVYDIAFHQNENIFASVGGDGSLRLFDLRSLEHSTIMYESTDMTPLLRLAWNVRDPNYVATIGCDELHTVILDIRVPSVPAAKLPGHTQPVNAVAWAPHSSCHVCTVADDHQAFIWDLSAIPDPIEEPILAYNAAGSVNSLNWNGTHQDWVSIAYDDQMQVLRV